MRRAARLLFRGLCFLAVRGARFLERAGRRLAYLSFSPAEFRALQVAEWEAFGEHSPFVDHQLFAWEVELFANHIKADDRILVVGAGTGRDVLPFLAKGHAVTALDLAPRALLVLKKKAEALGRDVVLVEGSIAEAILPPRSFDAIVFSWFCFGYVRGAAARLGALERCRASLLEGGRILISYETRQHTGGRSRGASTVERAMARLLGGGLLEEGDEFNLSGTAARPSGFFAHTFAPGDIDREARAVGLDVAFQGEPASGVGVMVLTASGAEARA